ncbi:MAG: hypothetical protein WA974_03540 [Thermodesulfobacteriota bacterium]
MKTTKYVWITAVIFIIFSCLANAIKSVRGTVLFIDTNRVPK